MENYILEVCVDSVESALAAKRGGATRLELCANLVIGGTTPGYTLFEQVKEKTGLPVRVLIRPRFGDFLYSHYEYEQMLYDIRYFAQTGVEEQMRGMIEAAGNSGITLHRAFDVCADPVVTLQRAAELGVDTILTSGQEADCVAGCELLRRLVQLSADKCEGIDSYCKPAILAGAGVSSANIAEIAKITGAHAFHMSGKKLCLSGMHYRNERVHMGLKELSEFQIYRTDETEIRRAVEILQSL